MDTLSKPAWVPPRPWLNIKTARRGLPLAGAGVDVWNVEPPRLNYKLLTSSEAGIVHYTLRRRRVHAPTFLHPAGAHFDEGDHVASSALEIAAALENDTVAAPIMMDGSIVIIEQDGDLLPHLAVQEIDNGGARCSPS